MPDATNLYLFIAAALMLLIVPGPNMAIVSSHAVAHGWRAGLAAALGGVLIQASHMTADTRDNIDW